MSKGKKIEKKVESIAGLIFEGPDSANAKPILQNVGPLQILAAGQFLIALAERQLNEVWTAEAMKQAENQAMIDELMRGRN